MIMIMPFLWKKKKLEKKDINKISFATALILLSSVFFLSVGEIGARKNI